MLVNAGSAMFYGGPKQIEHITHPRFRERLLSFESGAHLWYDGEDLSRLLVQAEDERWRKDVVDDLVDLFRRWRWRGKQDVMVVVGLVLATWIQTIWAWRPRIDVLGGTNTGKSFFCKAVAGLFRDCCIFTSDTTAAGLRQKIRNSAVAVMVDEVDGKNKAKMAKQREILEMLRSASRGTAALRGTGGGQKGLEFTLRHLVWVAGISIANSEQADKNRAISLNLIPPTIEKRGKLVVPPTDELQELGQRVLAASVWAAKDAVRLAVELKTHRVTDVDPRVIESYAVPAAMLATVLDYDQGDASQMMTGMLQDVAAEGEIESDETALISEILSSTRRIGTVNYTVGQMLQKIKTDPHYSGREGLDRELATVGIRVANGNIVIQYKSVRKLFHRDSDWHGQPVDQFLRRIDKHQPVQGSIGGNKGRGVMFDFGWFCKTYMGQDETDKQGIGF